VADRRRKDTSWQLPLVPIGESPSVEAASLAVLMDIRDELKALNNVLQCPNFLRIPAVLDDINRNTKKAPRKRSAKKP
jgi:hypothetical protein